MSNQSVASISSAFKGTQLSASHRLADKTLIIFDWDGTLMDSIGLIVESMHVAGEAHGSRPPIKLYKTSLG
ncbi:hypothetical protein [Psychrobacter sp. JCM 18903]|uniref:hypothetical protein n=1 Tax=Psychrobacter sp. JCM 18903 TaxID=1298610 RepID=UPI0004BCE0D8|nr:hypothetical protein [Psychrobacter sp. JCM 18903]